MKLSLYPLPDKNKPAPVIVTLERVFLYAVMRSLFIRLSRSAISVSYTHLDVYKRQVLMFVSWFVAVPLSIAVKGLCSAASAGLIDGATLASVSVS